MVMSATYLNAIVGILNKSFPRSSCYAMKQKRVVVQAGMNIIKQIIPKLY